MSGFSRDWLALREPYDAAARERAASQGLACWPPACRAASPSDAPLSILDLGGGTGANPRFLAPRLAGPQSWRVIEHDTGLLGALPQAMADWAARAGVTCHAQGEGVELAGAASWSARVEPVVLDLACRLHDVPFAGAHLVTASALLDLVSAQWLDALVAHCAAARSAVHFALSYDGRIAWREPHPDDGWLRDALNRHQLGDKGFGPALGPAAAGVARARLAEAGYLTHSARSDWHVGPHDVALQRALIDGWAAAAAEVDPAQRDRARAWRRVRLVALSAGRSSLSVGHVDLVGWPTGAAGVTAAV